MYIYQLNILLDGEPDSAIEALLEAAIEKCLDKNKINGSLESMSEEEISTDNFGKCEGCGAWTSDHTKPDAVREVSNGAVVDGKWLCDVCLPDDHPNAF